MKVIVTGATGLIGGKISEKLKRNRHEVIVFSRNPEKAKTIVDADDYYEWNPLGSDDGKWKNAIGGSDVIINLAGEGVVDKRWSESYKKRILKSRTVSTKSLVDEIKKSSSKPKQFISASAIGFYGYERQQAVDESSRKGEGFLADVVESWENSSEDLEQEEIVRTIIRIGIVIDKNGGALAKMLPPFRFFVGGPIGSGNQWFPWIHIDDLSELFIYAIEKNLSGVFNAVAPKGVTMNDFAKSLGKTIKRPSIFKVPEFVLKLIMGEAANAVIKGVNVSGEKAVQNGFKYKFANVDNALANLLK
ncbi:MAG: TIGR01777 family oxidoreductase [Melioribacteraceae bacterium]|nr:TIGR01777 family oxidoreductase [Melioribacteraceae bacterium]MCF8263110.1 TIGR01777 family oxidoreductase [Melioribacteraceae bacterium]MCF8413841.1 TIGR01777 family oxidoreductase [Melioribacteraceae bacterium]MCF8430558.1 TIGR01777 family oxidoreductase [Melioribacteraceae bacterium]